MGGEDEKANRVLSSGRTHYMINLSAEQINLHSPYKVERIAENSFIFKSNYGVIFNVGFADDYMLMNEGAYQLFISNVDGKSSPNDPLVKETIATIVKEFFNIEPAVVLYICDTSDDRQRVRDRLFVRWFKDLADTDEYTLINEEVNIDNTIYYGSLLMRNDHPLYEDIKTKFHDFAKELPEKLL